MNYRIRIRNSARNLIWIRIRIRIFFWIRYSPTACNFGANYVKFWLIYMYILNNIWNMKPGLKGTRAQIGNQHRKPLKSFLKVSISAYKALPVVSFEDNYTQSRISLQYILFITGMRVVVFLSADRKSIYNVPQ